MEPHVLNFYGTSSMEISRIVISPKHAPTHPGIFDVCGNFFRPKYWCSSIARFLDQYCQANGFLFIEFHICISFLLCHSSYCRQRSLHSPPTGVPPGGGQDPPRGDHHHGKGRAERPPYAAHRLLQRRARGAQPDVHPEPQVPGGDPVPPRGRRVPHAGRPGVLDGMGENFVCFLVRSYCQDIQ